MSIAKNTQVLLLSEHYSEQMKAIPRLVELWDKFIAEI